MFLLLDARLIEDTCHCSSQYSVHISHRNSQFNIREKMFNSQFLFVTLKLRLPVCIAFKPNIKWCSIFESICIHVNFITIKRKTSGIFQIGNHRITLNKTQKVKIELNLKHTSTLICRTKPTLPSFTWDEEYSLGNPIDMKAIFYLPLCSKHFLRCKINDTIFHCF